MQKQRLVALAIGLSAILAACSSSGASTAPSAAAATAAPSAAASAPAASAPAAGGTTIALADSSLGKKIIVDENGMTLYMFTPDDGQAAPTCATGCIDKWPALIADSPTAGAGLDASKLSTVARADGLGQRRSSTATTSCTTSPTTRRPVTSTARASGPSGTSSAPTASRSSSNPVRSHRDRSIRRRVSLGGARRRSMSGGLA